MSKKHCLVAWGLLCMSLLGSPSYAEEWGWAKVEMIGVGLGDRRYGPYVRLTHTRPSQTSFPFTDLFFTFDRDHTGRNSEIDDAAGIISILETAMLNGLEVHFLADHDTFVPPKIPIIQVIYVTSSPVP